MARIAVAATAPFGADVLERLAAEHEISALLTRPDAPRGRGRRIASPPAKTVAERLGVPVLQPERPEPGLELGAPVVVVCAYGLLVPEELLAERTWLNVHPSLLPRWRGAAPIQRALLAGDAETGATIMQMDAGLDTGPILDAVRIPIGPRDTSATLEHKLAAAGARALVAVLRRLATGEPIRPMPQPGAGAMYAAKIDKAEALIDWSANAVAIDRQVRAFDPAPGAHTVLYGETVKVWRAQPAPIMRREALPGTVLEANGRGIVVACGEGKVRIEELQPAGGRRMTAAAFAAGRRLAAGARFGASRA